MFDSINPGAATTRVVNEPTGTHLLIFDPHSSACSLVFNKWDNLIRALKGKRGEIEIGFMGNAKTRIPLGGYDLYGATLRGLGGLAVLDVSGVEFLNFSRAEYIHFTNRGGRTAIHLDESAISPEFRSCAFTNESRAKAPMITVSATKDLFSAESVWITGEGGAPVFSIEKAASLRITSKNSSFGSSGNDIFGGEGTVSVSLDPSTVFFPGAHSAKAVAIQRPTYDAADKSGAVWDGDSPQDYKTAIDRMAAALASHIRKPIRGTNPSYESLDTYYDHDQPVEAEPEPRPEGEPAYADPNWRPNLPEEEAVPENVELVKVEEPKRKPKLFGWLRFFRRKQS